MPGASRRIACASSAEISFSNSMLIASRMADEDRHAHAGRGHLDLRIEDLLGLDHHLPFLLGRAVVEEVVDVRDDVEGDLLGELHRLVGIADEDVAALLEQLVHARLAGAGDRLVGRDDDPLDRRRVVQRLQRHHHLRGRAIRVGDDVLAPIEVDRLGIHLGHDQRHVRVHPEEELLSITVQPAAAALGA